MDYTVGFRQIIDSMVELFGFIYTCGYFLIDFLTTPILENMPGMEDLLGDLASYTPFEFMFGPSIILVLVLAFVKFLTPL